MKKLSDFKDTQGIVVASKVLAVIMDILSDKRNLAMNGEQNAIKMFTAFMEHSPDKMREIFAILSEKEVKDYHCDGAENLNSRPASLTCFHALPASRPVTQPPDW